ncbi:MAG: oligosaccharide flippase family protein [Bacteroidetes bacterium]|jgi:O-antigen/teichoic acid export membrane protein|nr:oligosaccharide flippase family protein [Bacteroidota bacterium]
MQRKFITNLALLLLLNLLIKPFWIFGIDRTVQNMLGAEVYGKYYALLNFSFLLNILLDAGITNYNNKNISQHQHLVSKHFSGIVVLRFLLAGGYMLASLIMAFIVGYSTDDLYLLILLLVNQFFISFILYLRSNLSGLHLFKSDSLVSVTDRFLMIIFCSFLIWGNSGQHLEISSFVYAQTASYILTSFFAILLLKGRLKFQKITWQPAFYITILKQSAPFALLILLMTFYSRIDAIMLERLLPDGAFFAGVYAQAFRMLDAVNMFGYLFATLLLPMFAHMIKKHQPVQDLTRLSFTLLAVPSITLAISGLFYGKSIMELLYHEHADLSAPVFSILMFSFFCMATSYVFGTLLTANGSLKQLNIMAAAGMILNIGLNLLLIPSFKAYGAAIAGLTTQVVMTLSQILIAWRIFHLRFNYQLILKLLLFSIILLIAGNAMVKINYSVTGFCVMVIIGAILGFSLRIISISGIKTILGDRNA